MNLLAFDHLNQLGSVWRRILHAPMGIITPLSMGKSREVLAN
jgi:hypothetical protein